MKKGTSVFILFAVVLILTPSSHAEEQYQTEIATTYRRFDTWMNPLSSYSFPPSFFTTPMDNRTVAYGLTGEVFFAPVNTASHPFEEAAFLERTGSVFLSLERVEQRLGALVGTVEGTGSVLNLVVNYARSGSPLTIQASFEESEVNFSETLVDLKTNRYGIKIGDYITNGLLAGIGFDRTKTNELSGPFTVVNSEVLDYQLFLKYVHELERGRGIKLEAKLGRSRTTDDQERAMQSSVQSMSIVYYWTQTVSAGIGIQNTGGAAAPKGQSYIASIDYFISPRFSINAAYNRFLASSNVYGDSNSYNIALANRF